MKYLEHADNPDHAEYKCPKRDGRRHVFRLVGERELSPGKTENISQCEFCNARVKAIVDYTVMEDVNYLSHADLARAMALAASGAPFRGSLRLACDLNEAGADVAWSADVITPAA